MRQGNTASFLLSPFSDWLESAVVLLPLRRWADTVSWGFNNTGGGGGGGLTQLVGGVTVLRGLIQVGGVWQYQVCVCVCVCVGGGDPV